MQPPRVQVSAVEHSLQASQQECVQGTADRLGAGHMGLHPPMPVISYNCMQLVCSQRMRQSGLSLQALHRCCQSGNRQRAHGTG